MSHSKSSNSCSFIAKQDGKNLDSLAQEALGSIPSYSNYGSLSSSSAEKSESIVSSEAVSESSQKSESSIVSESSEYKDIDCMWFDSDADESDTSEIPLDFSYDYTDAREMYGFGVSDTHFPKHDSNSSLIYSYLEKKLPNILLILLILLSYFSPHKPDFGGMFTFNLGIVPFILYIFLILVHFDKYDKYDKVDLVKYVIVSIFTSFLLLWLSSYLGFGFSEILHQVNSDFYRQPFVSVLVSICYTVVFVSSLSILANFSLESLRKLQEGV